MNEKCLPGLYPKAGSGEDAPESEKKVYRSLKDDLPSNFFAWHSLKLRTSQGQFAETDFLIADPNQGLLILEVKGGKIKKEGGCWYSYDKKLKRPPLKQALRFRNALLDLFREKNIKPPGIGLALCLPDTPFTEQPTQADLEGLVVGENDLPYLSDILPDLMAKIPDFGKPGSGWIKAVHTMWCESWVPQMNLLTISKDLVKKRLELGKEQFDILCMALENDRVLVQGGPGTGKTILARELAKKEASEGKRVLLLTFTLALGSSLAGEFPEPDVNASSIGNFALNLLRKKGRTIEERYEPEFWKNITWEAAVEGLTGRDKLWDTVIVDEGQDMGEYQWDLIRECVRDDRRIWVFMDPGQGFWEDRTIPEALKKEFAKFNLTKAYRCPPGIQALVDSYAGKEVSPDPIRNAAGNGLLRINKCPEDEVQRHVGGTLNELIGQGFKPHDIAVLSLRGMGFKENIMHRKELGGHPVRKATDPDAKSHIVCDSFLRFKGLERPAVIVTDLRYVSDKYSVRMNIAASRAMSVLRIVGAEQEIEKDALLRRLS
ncbi:MAG: NERD domain-containing protein [Candidatus Aminicenantes bacterium]